jgi:hypothetical protein
MSTTNDKVSKVKSRKVRLIVTAQVPFDMRDTKVVKHIGNLLVASSAASESAEIKVSKPKIHKDPTPT